MDEQALNKITDSIKEKLGEETFATISDDMSEIINGNNLNNSQIAEKDETINTLNKRNADLVTANGNLFKRIPMGKEVEDKEDEKPKKIDIASLFDGQGHFKKKL